MDAAATIDKWWTFLVRGLLAILFGVVVLVWPTATVFVLIILFGCYALVEGLFGIGYSIAKASKGEKFFALLLLGLLGVLVGIIVLARPGVTSLAVIWVIAFWLVLRGFLMIISAFEMTGTAGVRWLVGITGAIAVVLGILMFIFPVSGIFGIILVVGLYCLVTGIFLTVVSFAVRKVQKTVDGTLTAA
ncbi:MAG TPA: DUF308 domain-containing protein [Candidatus Anoxymicrobiaceae bacterium]